MPSRFIAAFYVYAFAALGVLLLAVPWSAAWDAATAVYMPTPIGSWLRSGFVRGFISGLGALDLLAAWGQAREFLRVGREDDPLAPGAGRPR